MQAMDHNVTDRNTATMTESEAVIQRAYEHETDNDTRVQPVAAALVMIGGYGGN